ncbi:S41 family peptidase [Ningiella sp. W23]|uniref:S41 family peptidase n=1 Tax=Ningiella sp. W23 TaxID=3023715 RepID=UPI003757DC89
MKSLAFRALVVLPLLASSATLTSVTFAQNASTQSPSAPLVLQPALSPDGAKIAFTYQGDIWTVESDGGRADRLTIHEGYESRPVWSNDSASLAFSSDRFGNDDIFWMPESGGTPVRLTYHSGNDRVLSFTPDNQILFNARRTYAQVEREWEVLSIDSPSASSGASDGAANEMRFMDALGFDAVVSPDGSKVAFVRGTCRVSREAYRGPANRNIWVYDIEDDSYTQVTTFDGNDYMPQWVSNDSLYFISARSGKYNVHKAELDSDNEAQTITALTNETSFGVNHFSASADGAKIVYQSADRVFSISPDSTNKQVINIDVRSDFRFDPVVAKTVSNKVDEYAVSPNGKLSVYVHRGDIYVTRNDKEDKRSVRLTQGAARDRDVTWLNDNTIVFVSDREGQNDIFLLRSSDNDEKNIFQSLKHEIIRVTSNAREEFDPVVSPDAKRIAFRQDRGILKTANISEDGVLSKVTTLLDGWDIPSKASWSPDSIWLAYSLSDLNFNEEVYIHAADNSQAPVNVSMHPKYDSDPIWSPDGSKLGFISMRNNGDFDIWFAWLSEADWQRSKEEWRRLDKLDDEPSKKTSDDDEDKDDKEQSEEKPFEAITIDFDGIYKRLSQVTSFAGNETQMLFDKEGEHVYYSTGGPGRQNFKVDRNLYKIKWDGEDKKTLISGNLEPSQLELDESGKHLYALVKDGKIVRVETKNDKSESLNVTSKAKIDYAQERAQIFDEAWRALGAGFYDPNFHGQDWNALRDKYRNLALKASTKEDFQYMFNLMLGQLNASHMGLFRGENQKQTQKQRTGLLGIEGKASDAGFEILGVVPNTPADRVESKLAVGDIITEVDQQSVIGENFYALLGDAVNSPVLLNVKRAANGNSEEVIIWPTDSLSNALYDDWVEQRRRLTDEYSKGKLGYLHIRGMNWSSFERFERELMAAGYGKEGIVIDVRYNGGGWTTDYLMAVLNVKQHAYTIPRGATDDIDKNHREFKDTYPFAERLPLSAWTKPSIALSNENSYSNAEIFSHAYKANGIGKLVGRPTFGAVISTGGQSLVDGSLVRMPFRGWWVKESGENMEKVPAVPDIEVFNPPAYKAKGIDPQLKRAVDELLADLPN